MTRKDAITTVKEDAQLVETCIVCGGIADDVHHGRPHDLSQGKGSGGTSFDDHEHFTYLHLCRKCHEDVHQKRITIELEGAMVRVLRDGVVEAERALTYDDGQIKAVFDAPDFASSQHLMAFISDEGLAYLWAEATRFATQGYLYQCAIAATMRARYGGYGERWHERTAEIIGASARTVYDRWRAWGYLKDAAHPEDEIEQLGKSVVEAIGARAWKGEDVAALADQAMTAITSGTTRGAAAKALREHDDDPEPKCQRDGNACVCRWCGRGMDE